MNHASSLVATDGLAPGMMVTASIQLVRELGRGGMGSVWIAIHRRLNAEVVVKFIAREHLESTEAITRFEREASLAAQAKSPHVVQVFDHGIAINGLPYIAMELLEGEDLAARLARERTVPVATFAGWLAQACRGLGRAHAKGIVHRDIKPENIFLCDNDGDVLVKVLDFGIARGDTGLGGLSGTKTGAFMGTAFYMSPEQTMGLKTVDRRADLWAMGVVSYYALTGARPFDGDAIGQLVVAITSNAVVPPSHVLPGVFSPAIDVWMAKALAKNPEQRFDSAKEMAEAFTAASTGRLPSVSPASRTLLVEAPPTRIESSFQSSAPGYGTSVHPTYRLDGVSGPPSIGTGPQLPNGLGGSTMSPSVSPGPAVASPLRGGGRNAASTVVASLVLAGVAIIGGAALLVPRSAPPAKAAAIVAPPPAELAPPTPPETVPAVVTTATPSASVSSAPAMVTHHAPATAAPRTVTVPPPVLAEAAHPANPPVPPKPSSAKSAERPNRLKMDLE